ncbi:MAG: hypothetical protein Q9225_002121 [Loekoesia sp. 1 TL-2023]
MVSSSSKVKREPIPDDEDDVDPIYPAPSSARLALLRRAPEITQKENCPSSHDLPFRTLKSDQPSSSHLGLLRQGDTNPSVSHGHPNSDQSTFNLPSLSHPSLRTRSFSHPISQSNPPLTLDTKQEEQDTTTGAPPPLDIRRSSLPGPRTIEGRRLRRLQKLEWKKQLELGKDEFGAEQESLFSAAREKFSPDPVKSPPDGGPSCG